MHIDIDKPVHQKNRHTDMSTFHIGMASEWKCPYYTTKQL